MGKHLGYEQRCQIYALHQQGLTQEAIAEKIGSNQSVVSRELNRNRGRRGYRYKQAQAKADKRRHIANATPSKMTPDVVAIIETMLCEEQLSPEQISGWMRATEDTRVSHECIYRHIYADQRKGGTLVKHLRRTGKKYNKRKGKTSGRGLIPNRIDIDQRPAVVAERSRLGDWEADTIVGAEHKGAILSLVERVSKYTLLHKLDHATSDKTGDAIIAKMRPHQRIVHTITSDNGKEFAGHQRVAKHLDAGFYFAKPYHAWERGLNENTNGLVRQYFPKGSSFANVTAEDVERVQNLLNSRPRKTLGFQSPNEVFFAVKSPPPNG
jgi:transposase, IS30 family